MPKTTQVFIPKKFRTAYSPRVTTAGLSFEGDLGRTIQEQKKQTDINYILERYAQTGLADHVSQNEPQYGDFQNFDFHEHQNKVIEVKQMFDKLPSKIRASFDHDPQNFLDHIEIKENVEDMRDGILDNPIQPKELAPKAELDTATAEKND